MTLLLFALLTAATALAVNLSRKLYVERERHEAEIAEALDEADRQGRAFQSAWSRAADLTGENRRLAQAHGLDLAQMALAYVHSRPFVTSTLIGATSLVQLEGNLASAQLRLSAEVLAAIEAIHRRHTYPCP